MGGFLAQALKRLVHFIRPHGTKMDPETIRAGRICLN